MGPHQLSRPRRLIIALIAAAALWPPAARALTKSFIPIPEIITDPNEGNTFGLLGVVLFLDERDEIKYMLAPDATYNDTKGFFPTFRFFGYPTPTRRYSVVLGKSTTKDEDYEFEFVDRGYWEGRAFVLASFLHERDSTDRFFGFGNNSPPDPHRDRIRGLLDGESNYTGNDTVAQATPGVWLLPHVNLSYRMRIRRFSIEDGQVSSIPFIATTHPEVRGRGLDGGVFWAHQVALTYDSRDSIDIPTRGMLALAYSEAASRSLGSTNSFVKFGGEWRDFIPLLKGNPTLALRGLLDYTTGDRDIPFWELNSLGGRRTLRGYGGDRFIDFNRSLGSGELRTRVWQRKMFGVNAELELAPFLEAGQVFRHVLSSPVNDLHWVYGLGFRGVVRPQIVGFVDIGRGSEGSAIFPGVNYPF
jgi:outer membrane protein assembly factor BamA